MQSHSASKRKKEIARQEKQREKDAARLERKKGKPKRDEAGDVDPDIAGIVPGPQPPQE
jgi:hypothetical protein